MLRLLDFLGPGRPDDDEIRASFLPRPLPEKSTQLKSTGPVEELF